MTMSQKDAQDGEVSGKAEGKSFKKKEVLAKCCQEVNKH